MHVYLSGPVNDPVLLKLYHLIRELSLNCEYKLYVIDMVSGIFNMSDKACLDFYLFRDYVIPIGAFSWLHSRKFTSYISSDISC